METEKTATEEVIEADLYEISVNTVIRDKDIFWFQLYYTYAGVTGGIIGIILVIAISDLISNFSSVSATEIGFVIFVAAWACVINPMVIWYRSRHMMKKTYASDGTMWIKVDHEGIYINNNGKENRASWVDITKIVVLKNSIAFFVGKDSVQLLPLKFGDATVDTVMKVVKKYSLGIKTQRVFPQRKKK